MNDDIRQDEIKALARLYAWDAEDVLLQHVPLKRNDTDDSLFNEYHEFIQVLFSLRNDSKTSPELKQYLLEKAKKFNYPVQQITAVLSGKNENVQHQS